MREWPVRGSVEACDGDEVVAEGCIRANKGDEHATMGFFLAGFVRDQTSTVDPEAEFIRDERGHLVRDLMGIPIRKDQETPEESDTHAQMEAGNLTITDRKTVRNGVDSRKRLHR